MSEKGEGGRRPRSGGLAGLAPGPSFQGRGKGWRKGMITKRQGMITKPLGRGKGWRKGIAGQTGKSSCRRRKPPASAKLMVCIHDSECTEALRFPAPSLRIGVGSDVVISAR